MADDPALITEDLDKVLADGIRDTLVERIRNKTINASEIKAAMEFLEKRGYKYIDPGMTRKGPGKPNLPEFEDEGPIEFPAGVPMRRQA